MTSATHSPGARVLAASLREVREAHNYGLAELARVLKYNLQMMSQWERGTRIPRVDQVAAILGWLHASAETRDQLLYLTEHARDAEWLDANPGDLPPALVGVIEYERAATTITNWALLIIPGLLQTAGYARAILEGSGIGVDEVDARLKVRMKRQKILERDDPVQLNAIVSELAIRELVGDEDIMSDQVDHLVEMAEREKVSIRILPATPGYHPGKVGLFMMYEYEKHDPVVFLEHYHASSFVYSESGVAPYRKLAKLLGDKALSEDDSRAWLREAMR